MGRVILIRHGQAQAGGPDYDQLSSLGIRQSTLLGQWWQQTGAAFGAMVTGSMARHRATQAHFARAQANAVDGPARIDPAFDEFDFVDVVARHRPDLGDFAALLAFTRAAPRPAQAFQQIFDAALAQWMRAGDSEAYRESWPAFRRRCVDGLRRLIADPAASGCVTVFTSGGPIAAICQHVLDLSDHHTASLNRVLVNTGITHLRWHPAQVSLVSFNQAAHLEAPNQPELITHR